MEDQLRRVSCPFNPAHVIEPRRLQYHIIKCKKSLPPNHDFVQCKFWAMHYVKKSQLEEHHRNCEHGLAKQAQKRTLMSQTTCLPDDGPSNTSTETNSWHVDESWDNIPNDKQSIYSPKTLQDQSPYMIIPPGMTKAQRREFRENERRRLQDLELKAGRSEGVTSFSNVRPLAGNCTKEEPRKPRINLSADINKH